MIKVVQSSPPRTGSTLLLNLIHGFLSPCEQIHWNTEKKIDEFMITKTHETNLEKFTKKYEYEFYFIMTERYDDNVHALIDKKYKTLENVLIINYDEINVTENLSLDDVINNIYLKFVKFFPLKIIPQKDSLYIKKDMKKRILGMNDCVEKLKSRDFSYWDKFYGIHGSHRNRK